MNEVPKKYLIAVILNSLWQINTQISTEIDVHVFDISKVI